MRPARKHGISIAGVGRHLKCSPETVRKLLRQAEIDEGIGEGLDTEATELPSDGRGPPNCEGVGRSRFRASTMATRMYSGVRRRL